MKLILLWFVLISCVLGKKNQKCGKPYIEPKSTSGRIIHGEKSSPNSYPWHVGIFFKFKNKYNFFCGGSLINRYNVLTALHCFDEIPSFLELYVGVGLYNLTEAEPNKNLIKVSRIIPHESYNQTNFDNDIALLELSERVKLSHKVSTICLPSVKDIGLIYNKSCFIPGWGSMSQKVSKDSIATSLMQLKLKIMNFYNETLCQGNDDVKYCGYDMSQLHSNVCVGDSGGGLVYEIKDRWYAFGVVSFGNAEYVDNSTSIKCNNQLPTYFTIVPNYIKWINKHEKK